MALEKINIGTVPNDKTGDSLRTGGEKLNIAFDAIDANTAITENITISAPVDLDQIDADVLVNNSKESNATHTGDVAGSTVLTIQPNVIKDSMIDFGIGANQVSTTDLPEGTNLYYTEARVSSNTAVSANTDKVGITTQQANDITTNNAKNSYPSTDATKVGHITVTQAVDLDALESDVATNNTKISYTDSSTVAQHTTDISSLKTDYWSMEFTGDPIERSYRLVANSDKALTIDKIEGIGSSGTIDAKVTINGVDVTGTNITIGSVINTGIATGANSVVANDSVAVVLSNNSSSADLHIDVYFTEA